MASQRFARWLAGGLTVALIGLTPVAAFAHDSHDGGDGGSLSGMASLSDLSCSQLLPMVQAMPRLHSLESVRTALKACIASQAQTEQQNGQDKFFGDVGSGYGWAMSDIDLLQTMGIFQGMAPHEFAPRGHLTRAQFAALMERMFHLPQPTTPVSFIDVQPTNWAYADIEAASPYMSTFSTPGGTAFEPQLDVTRVEVAATLGKILVTENQATLPSVAAAQATFAAFTDGSLVPAGLVQYAAIAVTSGLMKGYPDGSFGVENDITRAEAAVLLARVLQLTESMSGSTGGTTGTVTESATFQSTSGTSIVVTLSGNTVTLPLATGYTVTIDGQTGTISQLTSGEALTITLNAQAQVTAIAATTTTGTTTESGTFDSTSGSSIVVTVNGNVLTLPLASSYTVTINGATGTLSQLTSGESVTLTLNSSSQVTAIAATTSSSGTTESGTFDSTNGSSIVVTVSGNVLTLPLASSYTVTINGATGSLSQLTSGESVTLTLNSSSQVTAIAATTATTQTSGYIVAVPSTVSLSVYSTSSGLSTDTLASGATVTLNGSTSSLSSLPVGDAVTVTLSGSQATSVAATTPSPAPVTGLWEGSSNGVATLYVNFQTTQVQIGTSPVVVINGQLASLGQLQSGVNATVDSGAVNGSALIIQ